MNISDDKYSMTLLDCIAKTLHRSRIPLKAIAELTGISYSNLDKYALPYNWNDKENRGSGRPFPLATLVPVIKATGNFLILDYIENSLGRVAFPLPPETSASLKEVCNLCLRAVREFGELMAEVEKSISDQVVTERELDRTRKEAYQAIQAIVNLLASLERTHEHRATT